MSLKDRLNPTIKPQLKEVKPKLDIREPLQIESLGIIEELLADDEINSIFVTGAKNIFINRKGKTHKSAATFRDNVQLENLIKKTMQAEGIELNEINPMGKFNYKEGVNITATLPPLSDNASLYIKCYDDKHSNLQMLQDKQCASKEIVLFLEALCSIRCNILITGSKNTLKTSLLSSLSKAIPSKNRGVVIDFQKEFKVKEDNITNFDFYNLKDENKKTALLNSIISSNPEMIFTNDADDKTILNLIDNQKGFCATLCAKNAADALDKITRMILKKECGIGYKKAKKIAYNAFDIIISVQIDDEGERKISALSQSDAGECTLKDIFYLNNNKEHQSNGIAPKVYEDIKKNALPLGTNVFDENYKHTYSKNLTPEIKEEPKKTINPEVLKKFKKEEPNPEEELKKFHAQMQERQELMKKAQEKFEEIKKHAQAAIEQEALSQNETADEETEKNDSEVQIEEIEIVLEEPENITDENQNENL